jgi:hypothetical protein
VQLASNIATFRFLNFHQPPRKKLQTIGVIAQRLFRLAAAGNVPNDGNHHSSVIPLHRTQHDIDGELAAVLASSIELQTGAHGARVRFSYVVGTVIDMPAPESFRQQRLDCFTNQFRGGIAEHRLYLRISPGYFALLIDDNNRVRREFKETT